MNLFARLPNIYNNISSILAYNGYDKQQAKLINDIIIIRYCFHLLWILSYLPQQIRICKYSISLQKAGSMKTMSLESNPCCRWPHPVLGEEGNSCKGHGLVRSYRSDFHWCCTASNNRGEIRRHFPACRFQRPAWKAATSTSHSDGLVSACRYPVGVGWMQHRSHKWLPSSAPDTCAQHVPAHAVKKRREGKVNLIYIYMQQK